MELDSVSRNPSSQDVDFMLTLWGNQHTNNESIQASKLRPKSSVSMRQTFSLHELIAKMSVTDFNNL